MSPTAPPGTKTSSHRAPRSHHSGSPTNSSTTRATTTSALASTTRHSASSRPATRSGQKSGGASGSTYAYVDNRPAVFVDPDGLGKAWPGRPYPGSAGGVLQGLAYANCFGEGLARGTSCRASALGRILRSDPNSARRSAAGKRLPGVGRLAKGPIRWLGRGALPVGIGLDATDNFSEGRTPGDAAGRTVAQGLGGLAGGLAGGLDLRSTRLLPVAASAAEFASALSEDSPLAGIGLRVRPTTS